MTNTNTRQSNFELLRIIAIFGVVGTHYFTHGVGCGPSVLNQLFRDSGLFAFGNTSVAIFLLISGWFLSTSSFSWKKVFKLASEVFFYSILCLIIAICMKLETVDFKLILKSLFPISTPINWYAGTFIIAYCFTPFIRTSLGYFHANEKQYRYFIATGFVCFVMLGSITPYNGVIENLSWMFFLFYVGDYIRLIDSKKIHSAKQYLCLFILVKIIEWTFYLCILFFLQYKIPKTARLLSHLTERYSVGTFFEAVFLVLLFSKFNIKSKTINSFASSTFGIYIIHLSPALYPWIWKTLIRTDLHADGISQILHFFQTVSIIIIIGYVIDQIRKYLFEKPWLKMYDLIANSKSRNL